MFGNFAKLDSPRRLVQFWQNFQTSLVLLIPNCTSQRMITYTKIEALGPFYTVRRISLASNAIQTIDNQVSCLIIYCLNYIRRDGN